MNINDRRRWIDGLYESVRYTPRQNRRKIGKAARALKREEQEDW